MVRTAVISLSLLAVSSIASASPICIDAYRERSELASQISKGLPVPSTPRKLTPELMEAAAEGKSIVQVSTGMSVFHGTISNVTKDSVVINTPAGPRLIDLAESPFERLKRIETPSQHDQRLLKLKSALTPELMDAVHLAQSAKRAGVRVIVRVPHGTFEGVSSFLTYEGFVTAVDSRQHSGAASHDEKLAIYFKTESLRLEYFDANGKLTGRTDGVDNARMKNFEIGAVVFGKSEEFILDPTSKFSVELAPYQKSEKVGRAINGFTNRRIQAFKDWLFSEHDAD